jgi:hypothetical protein
VDLKQAVELFDEFFGDNDTALRFNSAWQTLKARCTQPTDVQQLKLEIAALANELEAYLHVGHYITIEDVVLPKLRQLSSN